MDTETKRQEKQSNIFIKLVLSCYRFDAYPGFLHAGKGKTFLYSLLLITVTFLVTFVYPSLIPSVESVPSLLGISEADIKKIVPYFEISNGQFFIEEPLIADNDPVNGMLLYITSEEIFPLDTSLSVLNDYYMGIIVDSEKMITGGIFQQPTVYRFSNYPNDVMTREALVDFLPWFKLIVVLMYVPVFIAYIGAYMFGLLVCTLIGMAVNVFIKAPLNFGEMFKLTTYARTVPIIFKMIILLPPFGVSMPFTVFYALFILYMVWALLAVKKSEVTDISGSL